MWVNVHKKWSKTTAEWAKFMTATKDDSSELIAFSCNRSLLVMSQPPYIIASNVHAGHQCHEIRFATSTPRAGVAQDHLSGPEGNYRGLRNRVRIPRRSIGESILHLVTIEC